MFPCLPVTLLDIPGLPLDGSRLPDPALGQLDGNGGLQEGTAEQPWGFRQWCLNQDELGLVPHRSRTCPARADRGLCNASGRSGLPSSEWVLLCTLASCLQGLTRASLGADTSPGSLLLHSPWARCIPERWLSMQSCGARAWRSDVSTWLKEPQQWSELGVQAPRCVQSPGLQLLARAALERLWSGMS